MRQEEKGNTRTSGNQDICSNLFQQITKYNQLTCNFFVKNENTVCCYEKRICIEIF